MATRDEVAGSLQVLINEARRIGARFTDDEWAAEGDEAGWTRKQVLAHIAGVGSMVVPFASSLANAGQGANLGENFNIDAINAQIVAQRADKSVAELVAEIESAYGAVIDYVGGAPDSLLETPVEFADFRGITLAEIVNQMVALHGIAHIYHAASRV
jgi:hypothetical protein